MIERVKKFDGTPPLNYLIRRAIATAFGKLYIAREMAKIKNDDNLIEQIQELRNGS